MACALGVIFVSVKVVRHGNGLDAGDCFLSFGVRRQVGEERQVVVYD